MKLGNQVCSLELAKRLKELGVNQESLFYWQEHLSGGQSDLIQANEPADDDYRDFYSAFTVAELGGMLPENILRKRFVGENVEDLYAGNAKEEQDVYFLSSSPCIEGKHWWVGYEKEGKGIWKGFSEDSEADARAAMLIYLLENKLVSAS